MVSPLTIDNKSAPGFARRYGKTGKLEMCCLDTFCASDRDG